jgi:hypothetical protein
VLTPVRAADMTIERTLNPQREPQNWISSAVIFRAPNMLPALLMSTSTRSPGAARRSRSMAGSD